LPAALSRDGQSIRIPLQGLLTEPTKKVLVKPGDVIAITRPLEQPYPSAEGRLVRIADEGKTQPL